MHMHAAQHVAVADHLQVVHDRAVARLRGDDLLGPERERERAHGGEAEFVLGGRLPKRAAIMYEMAARLLHGRAGRRRHLDLRLQHLGHDAVAQFFARAREEFFVDAAHGPARLGVEHEIFFFHADRIHARDNPPDGTRFPAHDDAITAAGRAGGRLSI